MDFQEHRDAFVRQAKEIIDLAWIVNGRPGIPEGVESELRVLNGLLALALVEFTSRPYDRGAVALRDVLTDKDSG